MLKSCANNVEKPRKPCGYEHFFYAAPGPAATARAEKTAFSAQFSAARTLLFPRGLGRVSPMLIHHFSPFSTGPITMTIRIHN